MTSKNLSNLLSILIRLSLVVSAMTVVFPSQITAQIQPRTQTPDKSGGNTGLSGITAVLVWNNFMTTSNPTEKLSGSLVSGISNHSYCFAEPLDYLAQELSFAWIVTGPKMLIFHHPPQGGLRYNFWCVLHMNP